MKWQKILLLCSPLFTFVLGLFVSSVNVSAANLTTSKIGFYMREFNQQSYYWTQRRDSGWSNSFTGVAAVRQYGIKYDGLYTTGNYASLHFETNLVAYTERASNPQQAFSWLNRDSIVVKACSFNDQPLTIESNNVSTAVTDWWQDFDTGVWFYSSTLTLYGDVTFSGIPQNTSGTLVCDVGTDSNSDYFWSNESSGSYIYWEKNPTVIVFGSNLNDTLLQTQIDQNTTIINQIDATNEWLTDDTAPSADTSSLGNAAGWLPAGPLDSILNLPVQFIQGIIGVFTNTNTCSSIVLPLDIIDYDLEIPCMRPFFELASVNIVWNTVGTIISAVVIFQTLKWLYKFVDDTLSFRENGSTIWGGL